MQSTLFLLFSTIFIPKQKTAEPFSDFIAIAICIRTNQNPNSVRRREAPPHTIWVLCPNKNGDSYKKPSSAWLFKNHKWRREVPPLMVFMF
jgi:hypothetical protein